MNEIFLQSDVKGMHCSKENIAQTLVLHVKIELPLSISASDGPCVKSVLIQSFSSLYLTAFGLNADIYIVNLRIQSKCGKIRTRKTPNTDTFHAVNTMAEINTNLPRAVY